MAMGPAGGAGALNYAAFDEFGTGDTAPHSFMRPAWDSGKQRALDGIKDDLWVEIRAASARAARSQARRAAP